MQDYLSLLVSLTGSFRTTSHGQLEIKIKNRKNKKKSVHQAVNPSDAKTGRFKRQPLNTFIVQPLPAPFCRQIGTLDILYFLSFFLFYLNQNPSSAPLFLSTTKKKQTKCPRFFCPFKWGEQTQDMQRFAGQVGTARSQHPASPFP